MIKKKIIILVKILKFIKKNASKITKIKLLKSLDHTKINSILKLITKIALILRLIIKKSL